MRYRKYKRIISFVALLLLVLPKFAMAQSAKPVVFVPGILGTKLCDKATNLPVWGGIKSLNNFAKLDLEDSGNPALIPCGLVDKIDLLGPFWAIHNYDKLFEDLKQLGYENSKTLFPFPYDWRQSNLETAKLLKDLFAAEIALALEKMLRGGTVRIKTVAGWTGANERTVKNWVSGRYGPCGTHLIVLMQHSDEVIESVLSMVGLDDLRLAKKLITMEQHMQELASMIRALKKTIER
jgi:hypothetical protein